MLCYCRRQAEGGVGWGDYAALYRDRTVAMLNNWHGIYAPLKAWWLAHAACMGAWRLGACQHQACPGWVSWATCMGALIGGGPKIAPCLGWGVGGNGDGGVRGPGATLLCPGPVHINMSPPTRAPPLLQACTRAQCMAALASAAPPDAPAMEVKVALRNPLEDAAASLSSCKRDVFPDCMQGCAWPGSCLCWRNTHGPVAPYRHTCGLCDTHHSHATPCICEVLT